MKRKSVCWNITSRCNENCEFCYRILCNKENRLEQNKKILDALIALKIEKITWTGGECLLYPYLYDLMREAHKNGIKNNIITNGKALTVKDINKIEEFTDYITFSLDTLNEELNYDLGRGRGHTSHILELMDYITNNDINIKLKLNSIVTSKNINDLKEVAEIVKKYDLERWKIFKFISLRGNSIYNEDKFSVSDEEYEDILKYIKNEKMDCPVIECKEQDIQNKYLLINAIGQFLVTLNGEDKVICDYTNIDLNKIREIVG